MPRGKRRFWPASSPAKKKRRTSSNAQVRPTSGVPMRHRRLAPGDGAAGCARGRAPCAARQPGRPGLPLADGHSRSGFISTNAERNHHARTTHAPAASPHAPHGGSSRRTSARPDGPNPGSSPHAGSTRSGSARSPKRRVVIGQASTRVKTKRRTEMKFERNLPQPFYAH